jgi:streptogramin lyase
MARCSNALNPRTLAFTSIIVVILFAAPHIYAQEAEIKVKEWDVPTPNAAPHDIVVDRSEIVWFTEINASKETCNL